MLDLDIHSKQVLTLFSRYICIFQFRVVFPAEEIFREKMRKFSFVLCKLFRENEFCESKQKRCGVLRKLISQKKISLRKNVCIHSLIFLKKKLKLVVIIIRFILIRFISEKFPFSKTIVFLKMRNDRF